MKNRITNVVLLGLAFFLSGSVASAAPKPKHHALPEAASLAAYPVEHPVKTAKFTVTGLVRTVGGVLRLAEAGADIAHGGTTGLSKAAGLELKHNPFVYPDKVAAFADTKLEQGYYYLWHVQI